MARARLDAIRDNLADRHHTAYETFAAENQNLQLIQRQQAIAHFDRRTRQDEQRLATLVQNNRSEKIQKLAKARLEITRQRRDEKLNELERKAEIDQQLEEISAGVFINEP